MNLVVLVISVELLWYLILWCINIQKHCKAWCGRWTPKEKCASLLLGFLCSNQSLRLYDWPHCTSEIIIPLQQESGTYRWRAICGSSDGRICIRIISNYCNFRTIERLNFNHTTINLQLSRKWMAKESFIHSTCNIAGPHPDNNLFCVHFVSTT